MTSFFVCPVPKDHETTWLKFCLVKVVKALKVVHVFDPVLYIYYAISIRSVCGRCESANQTTSKWFGEKKIISTIRVRLRRIRTSSICKVRANEIIRKLRICIAFSIIWPILDLLLPESKQLFKKNLLLFEYQQNSHMFPRKFKI